MRLAVMAAKLRLSMSIAQKSLKNNPCFMLKAIFRTSSHSFFSNDFRRFIAPDSVVVGININGKAQYTYQNLEGLVAVTPSGLKVLVLNNRDSSTNYQVSIVNDVGDFVNLELEARSWTTVVYK